MNQSPRVFISYARSDGERFATELRQRLERDEPEITLWQDRAQMEGGKDWWRQILEALDAVQFMVLVMTPAALRSPVVRKEWQAARQRGVCVYPVVGAPDLDFAAMPRWMSRAHFFDLAKEWQTFVNYLKSPCTAVRAPFMAPDLPEGHVERTGLMSQLLDAVLDEARDNARSGAAVLYGAGGFGKTTLAAALCHHDAVLTAYDAGVLWVTLGERPNLLSELTSLYAALTGERPGFANEQDAAVHLAEKLGEANTLLVVDDVWNAAHLDPFLRGGPGCARLVTTRQFEVAARFETRLEVYEMGTDEAARMLAARLPQPPADLAPFRALASRLGEWPLMLDLAGAALRQRVARGDTLPGALDYLNKALDRRGAVAFDQGDAVARNQALARSMAVSLDLLAGEERRRYLELAIFPEDVNIPLAALGALWGMDGFDAEALAGRLADLSLLRYDLPGRTVRLHDVVRAYLAGRLDNPVALHARLVEAWGDPHHLPDAYAWRWIGYHLVAAGRASELRALLFDYAWLRAKLAATGINELVADYERLPDDSAAQRVGRGLRQAAYVLAADPAQLAGQLLGRLLDDPAPEVGALLAQAAAAQRGVWLRPLQASLREPEALVRTLAGHTGVVAAVAVTPDGRYAVSASDDGTLKVWDLATGQAARTLEGHTRSVNSVAVTPDGRYAVSASGDGTLKVWDLSAALKAGLSAALKPGLSAELKAGLPAPAAQTQASKGEEGTGGPGTSQAVHTLEGHTGPVEGVALTPDGRYAISASDDHTLKVWDLAAALTAGPGTSQAVHTLTGHVHFVNGVAVTPDGRYAVSASTDGTLKVWDLSVALQAGPGTSRAVRTLDGHTGRVIGVAVTRDGRYAVSASGDKTLRVWDLAAALKAGPGTSQTVHTLEGHTDWVRGVAVTPDGRYAVSASDDKTLKVWDLAAALEAGPGTSQAVRTLEVHTDWVRGVAVTLDGRYAISASDDHTLKMWDLAAALGAGLGTSQTARTLEGHTAGVSGVAVTPDGRYAISASYDKTLKVWDLSAALRAGPGVSQAVHTLAGHTDFVAGVAVTGDGHYAVSASWDRTLKVWDLVAALQAGPGVSQAVHTLEGHTDWVRGVAVTPDGRYAVSASTDGTLKVWDLSTALKASLAADRKRKAGPGTSQAVYTLKKGHTGWVTGVAVTPDGRYAISASYDETLKVWDLSAAFAAGPGASQAVHTLAGHMSVVWGVAMTSDGRYAVSASDDKTLKVWDLAAALKPGLSATPKAGLPAPAAQPVLDRNGPGAQVSTGEGVGLSAELKPGLSEGVGPDTSQAVRTLASHTSVVKGVALTPDGRYAVSASDDQTLKVWELESGQLLASFYAGEGLRACAVAPDGVTVVAGSELGRLHLLRLEGLERAETDG
jgi:WD40 repeat protein